MPNYILFFLLAFIAGAGDSADLDLNTNGIFNETSLRPFFEKLKDLDQSDTGKLAVVHIGDSHIQADFFSGRVRQNLQKRFGNAGRGFVFPYKLANTSGSIDVKIDQKGNWSSCNIMKDHKGCRLGLAGYSVRGDTGCSFTIDLRSRSDTIYYFDKLTIFGSPFVPLQTNGDYNTSLSDTGIQIFFESRQDSLTFVPVFKTVQSNIEGFVLENEQSGILYHATGVNGSGTLQYLRSQKFETQIKKLNAQLVIISFGTNDCYMSSSRFCTYCVIERYRKIVSRIRSENPSACILLTSPPDSYLYRKYSNTNIPKLQKAMKRLCFEQNIALWDLYSIMGGKYSIKNWYREGLARRDYIHFSKEGYLLQADLLFEALINSYKKGL